MDPMVTVGNELGWDVAGKLAGFLDDMAASGLRHVMLMRDSGEITDRMIVDLFGSVTYVQRQRSGRERWVSCLLLPDWSPYMLGVVPAEIGFMGLLLPGWMCACGNVCVPSQCPVRADVLSVINMVRGAGTVVRTWMAGSWLPSDTVDGPLLEHLTRAMGVDHLPVVAGS